MPGNFASWLLELGEPDAIALLSGQESLSYRQLRGQVEALAAELLHCGYAPGDRIAIFSDNSIFFVRAYLAILRAGLVAVPFPPGSGDSFAHQAIQTCEPRALFVQNKHLAAAQNWAPGLKLHRESDSLPNEAKSLPAADSSALALLAFTSGSTGSPKAVMVTHQNLHTNTGDIVQYLALTAADRAMAVLPLSYCFGASVLHSHLRAGASIVLRSSFMFPEKAVEEMASQRCTTFAGVPSTYQILLRKTSFAQRQLPALRCLQQAGGKLPPSTIQEVIRAQPQAEFFVMYGQTEATARLSYLPPPLLATKLGSVGQGLPSTRLEVLKADGSPVLPGSDEIGEIVASGPNITPGYWGSPEETARFFPQGKLHTGDLARMDADGFIFIVDRARDFIKSMGNRVSPQEIEETLAMHPGILHSAVIGVPDELFGEAIVAYIVGHRAGSLDIPSLQAFCIQHLPNHKVPQQFHLVPELPMNDFGKVLKAKLRNPDNR